MKLLQAVDTTSNRFITIKLYKVKLPDCELPEVWLHVLGGHHETEEEFDKAWDEWSEKDELNFFFSLDLLDARKLTNALIEEIQRKDKK